MIKMHKFPCLLCLSVLCNSTPYSHAADLNPLNSRFSSPIEGLFNLPGMSNTQLLNSDQQQAGIRLEVISNAVTMDENQEVVRFDGETWRLTPTWKIGLNEHWQFSAELPLIRHSSGFLDNAIDKWHDIFNFREGSRDDFSRNELVYGYQNQGSVDYLISSSENGLGDLRLKLSKSFLNESPFLLHFHVKAPTGNEEKLMGSNGWDIGTSLSYVHSQLFKVDSLSFAAELGQHYLGSSDQIRNQEHFVTTLHSGLFWAATDTLSIKGQLESHTRLSDSELEPIESQALQISLGFSYLLTKSQQLNVAFSEDIKTDSTTDITFLLEWNTFY